MFSSASIVSERQIETHGDAFSGKNRGVGNVSKQWDYENERTQSCWI